MAKTQVRTGQLEDGGVTRDDLNTATTGKAVVRKLVQGTGVTLVSTGADAGTGDVTISGGAFTSFTKDLGAANNSGSFDITGLSGLTADKVVLLIQTAGAITSKGSARDEPEMDLIQLTGYVVNATTIRAYWKAPSIVVGTYEFAYAVSA